MERLSRRRLALAAVALAADFALVGCQKVHADDWAAEKYGPQAAKLKREASEAYQVAELVPGGLLPKKEGVLPRPIVVFQVAYGQDDWALQYHRLNRRLDAAATPEAARGFAIVRYGMKSSNKGWVRKRGRGPVEIDGVHEEVMTVTFVDRATRRGTKILVAGSDDDALLEAVQATSSFVPPP